MRWQKWFTHTSQTMTVTGQINGVQTTSTLLLLELYYQRLCSLLHLEHIYILYTHADTTHAYNYTHSLSLCCINFLIKKKLFTVVADFVLDLDTHCKCNSLCQQDPILGRESADNRGALDVSGAVRDLFLKTFHCFASNYFLF